MALTKEQIDLILNMKTKEFFSANKKAIKEYNKTKSNIEKRPVHFKQKGQQNILKNIAKMGMAYIGFQQIVVQSIKLSNVQEKADTALATSLKNLNIYTKQNYKVLKDQASAIQAVTTAGDESNQMLQTMALNMGIGFDKIDEVTRGSIGLAAAFKSAGLSQETAMKGIALAYQGNFTQLNRYIPALRSAKTETEKMAILQTAMKDGFVLATEEAKTGAGQMEQFANSANDFREVLGDLLKEGILPILKTLKPFLDMLNDMDSSTRNNILAIGALAIALWKIPPALKAIKWAVKTLQASMGPAGWLMLGISAVVTAFMAFQEKGNEAAKTMENFHKKIKEFDTYQLKKELEILTGELQAFKDKTQLLGEDYAALTEEYGEASPAMLEAIQNQRDLAESFGGDFISPAVKQISFYELRINELNKRLSGLREDSGGEGGNDDGSGEISMPSIALADTGDIDRLHVETKQKTIELYDALYEIETDFNDLSYQDLETQYAFRSDMINTNLTNIADAHGIESKKYQDMMNTKLQMDRNYQASKKTLEVQAAQASVQLLSQFMSAFQGQSEAMFNIGKMASLANAAINTYEGATKALSAYPPPFNAIAAAATIALGLAQIAKISSTTFTPAGKKEGGEITLADIAPSAFTPRGEDGIIGVRVGETIMNQGATNEFANELAYMNRIGRQRAQYPVPGYAEGGTVTDVASVSTSLDPAVFAAVIENGIKKGFDRSKLKIEGQFKAKGQDLESALNKREKLKSQA